MLAKLGPVYSGPDTTADTLNTGSAMVVEKGIARVRRE